MKLRHAAVLVLAAVALGACKKKQPAVAPAPTMSEDTAAMRRAREQAQADSIAAARRAEAERSARERAAAVARVREALADKVYFDYDSDALTQESQDKLRTKVAIMQSNPSLAIRVAGHTDSRGSEEYNLALGQRRAEAVRDFITGYGISGGRVTTISYGEEMPAAEGTTEDAYSQNRRAEFSITGGEVTAAPPEVR